MCYVLSFKLTVLPNDFLELIKKSDMKIVGVLVSGDIAKIGRCFRCEHVTKSLKHVTNLGSFEKKRNVVSNGVVKLKTIV